MTSISSQALVAFSKKVQAKETFLLLSVAIIYPFLVHLIPSVGNVPMGAILLPAFVAPFIANHFYKIHVGLFIAVVAPTLNYILTGRPKLEALPLYTAELVLFTVVSLFFLKQDKLRFLSAPLAFIIAKLFTDLFALIVPVNFLPQAHTLQSLLNAIPGIILLIVLSFSLTKIFNK